VGECSECAAPCDKFVGGAVCTVCVCLVLCSTFCTTFGFDFCTFFTIRSLSLRIKFHFDSPPAQVLVCGNCREHGVVMLDASDSLPRRREW
jgi:hypothetical protein